MQQLFDRVESKIHFGDHPDDVRDWLLISMNIDEDTADQMIRNASKKRAGSIRIKALIICIVSAIAILIALVILYLNVFGTDGVYLVRRSFRVITCGVGLLGLGAFGLSRYFPKLVSGRDIGAAN